MSAAGISSSGLFGYGDALSEAQKLQTDFQQLGKDLQAGNLSAAQSDFATLNQDAATFSPGAGAQGNSPIDQEFQQIAGDLQAGNLSAAQKDYAAIQQDLQGGASPSSALSVVAPDSGAGGQTAPGGVQGASQGQSDDTQSQSTQRHGHHHGHHHAGGNDGGSGEGELTQLEGQLGQALQSGNLGAAQQVYNSLSQAWAQDGQNGLNGPGSGQPPQATPTQVGTTSVSASVVYVSININVTA